MYKFITTIIAAVLVFAFGVPVVTNFTEQVSQQVGGLPSIEGTIDGSFDQAFNITG